MLSPSVPDLSAKKAEPRCGSPWPWARVGLPVTGRLAAPRMSPLGAPDVDGRRQGEEIVLVAVLLGVALGSGAGRTCVAVELLVRLVVDAHQQVVLDHGRHRVIRRGAGQVSRFVAARLGPAGLPGNGVKPLEVPARAVGRIGCRGVGDEDLVASGKVVRLARVELALGARVDRRRNDDEAFAILIVEDARVIAEAVEAVVGDGTIRPLRLAHVAGLVAVRAVARRARGERQVGVGVGANGIEQFLEIAHERGLAGVVVHVGDRPAALVVVVDVVVQRDEDAVGTGGDLRIDVAVRDAAPVGATQGGCRRRGGERQCENETEGRGGRGACRHGTSLLGKFRTDSMPPLVRQQLPARAGGEQLVM